MLEKYFAELIQCAGTVYLAISIFIALIKAPSDETYKPYRTAKGLLAAAFAAMALNLFAWCCACRGALPSRQCLGIYTLTGFTSFT